LGHTHLPKVENRVEPLNLCCPDFSLEKILYGEIEEGSAVARYFELTSLPCPEVSIGLEKLNRFKPLGAALLFSNAMEPTNIYDVHVGFLMNKEIMMMPQPVQAVPSKQIPQHVVERMESEWKQIRESATKPADTRR